jgi:hypothetical protein
MLLQITGSRLIFFAVFELPANIQYSLYYLEYHEYEGFTRNHTAGLRQRQGGRG